MQSVTELFELFEVVIYNHMARTEALVDQRPGNNGRDRHDFPGETYLKLVCWLYGKPTETRSSRFLNGPKIDVDHLATIIILVCAMPFPLNLPASLALREYHIYMCWRYPNIYRWNSCFNTAAAIKPLQTSSGPVTITIVLYLSKLPST